MSDLNTVPLSWCLEPSQTDRVMPDLKTVPRGGQMECFQGERRGLQLSAEPSIPPVNTVERGGQMERF